MQIKKDISKKQLADLFRPIFAKCIKSTDCCEQAECKDLFESLARDITHNEVRINMICISITLIRV